MTQGPGRDDSIIRWLKRIPTIAVVLLLGYCGDCFTDTTPALAACAPRAWGRRPSNGDFEILPSEVPGVELDSLGWSTWAGHRELAMQSALEIRGRLVSTSDRSLDEVAVLIEGLRDTTVVYRRFDTDFIEIVYPDSNVRDLGELRSHDRIAPGHPAPVWVIERTLGSRPDPSWGCPTRARVISISRQVTRLGVTGQVAHDTARLLSARRRSKGGRLDPIEVAADTIFENAGLHARAGFLVNTTGQPRRDVIVSIAARDRDTVRVLVGDVPAHALVPFASKKAPWNAVTFTVTWRSDGQDGVPVLVPRTFTRVAP